MPSCTGDASRDLVTFDLIGNYDAPDTDNFQDVADIRLAMNPVLSDSTLIDRINLCGIVDGCYYICSKRNMIFEPDGSCVTSFMRNGNGPGEHGMSRDHWADVRTGGWAIATFYDNSIYNYTFDGVFTGKDTVIAVDNIYPRPDGWLGVKGAGHDKSPTKFYYFDYDWRLVDSVMTSHVQNVYVFQVSDFPVIAVDPFDVVPSPSRVIYCENDTVFDVSSSSDRLKPVAAVATGGKCRPDDVNPFQAAPDEYLRYKIYTTDKHALIMCNGYKGRTVMQVYDLRDGNLVLSLSNDYTAESAVGIPVEYKGHKLLMNPLPYTTDDTFYFWAPTDAMSELTGDEEANPAIFALTMK